MKIDRIIFRDHIYIDGNKARRSVSAQDHDLNRTADGVVIDGRVWVPLSNVVSLAFTPEEKKKPGRPKKNVAGGDNV